MKKYFKSKKLVYTKHYAPAELVKIFSHGGRRYIRIAFSNRAKHKGLIPVTDVRYPEDVVGIRKLPSAFKKGCFKLVGIRAKGTYYKIEKLPI